MDAGRRRRGSDCSSQDRSGAKLANALLGCVLVYSALFGVGEILLRSALLGVGLLVVSALAAIVIVRNLDESPT